MPVILTIFNTRQGRNEWEGRGHDSPVAKSLWEAPKSPKNVTNTFFATAHLLPKDLKFKQGAPN